MVSQRNRIIELAKYFDSIGIDTNIWENKARGNKGFFSHGKGRYRIDVAKSVPEDKVVQVLIHEFSHYVHYLNDKTLKKLEFAFGEMNQDIHEELVKVTLEDIPREYAKSFFQAKDEINNKIYSLSEIVRKEFPSFKLSSPNAEIEKNLELPLKYLLKYDKVKFFNKIYSIDSLDKDFKTLSEAKIAYFKIKSQQRFLRRINSKINRLNKYYNNPTELFARFSELFYTNYPLLSKLAPNTLKIFEENLKTANLEKLRKLKTILDMN